MTRKYLIYVRKSTDTEEKQKLSIPAQLDALHDYAERLGLTVVGKPYVESCSAKRPGRPVFSELMNDIENGRGNAILCWHLDRLARNPLDGGSIMYYLGNGTIQAISTPEQTYKGTGDDKLMMSIIFGMATKYSDDLSRNTKRGNTAALKRGQWPHRPKLGYMRDPKTRDIVPDPDSFPLVKRIWRERLLGVPVAEIRRQSVQWGLKTPIFGRTGGKYLSSSQMYRLLKEPFYAGVMEHGGESYPGTHESMITWAEFEQVQHSFEKANTCQPRPKEIDFLYRGIFFCGACGAMVTAQHTTNRHGTKYTYYFCCKKRKKYNYCPQRAVQEESIDSAFMDFVGRLAVPTEVQNIVFEVLEEANKKGQEPLERQRKALQLKINTVDARLTRLRRMCADQQITDDEFEVDRQEALREKAIASCELESLRTHNDVLKPFQDSFSLVNRAKNLWENGTMEERKHLVRLLCSNPYILNKTVHISANSTIKKVQQLAALPRLCPKSNNVHTLIRDILGVKA